MKRKRDRNRGRERERESEKGRERKREREKERETIGDLAEDEIFRHGRIKTVLLYHFALVRGPSESCHVHCVAALSSSALRPQPSAPFTPASSALRRRLTEHSGSR